MTQLPPPIIVTVVPEIEHTVDDDVLNVTVKPESLLAVKVIGESP